MSPGTEIRHRTCRRTEGSTCARAFIAPRRRGNRTYRGGISSFTRSGGSLAQRPDYLGTGRGVCGFFAGHGDLCRLRPALRPGWFADAHRRHPAAASPKSRRSLSGALPQAPYRLIPVKFVGGAACNRLRPSAGSRRTECANGSKRGTSPGGDISPQRG